MSDLWCWWTQDDRMGREFRIGFKPGDRLWVAEGWQVAREALDYETGDEYDVFEWYEEDYGDPREHLNGSARFGIRAGIFYEADSEDDNPSNFYPLIGVRGEVLRDAEIEWRAASEMPRWASRLTLIVECVRVERLQDISEEDAVAEGAMPYYCAASALDAYPAGHAALACNHRAGFWQIWSTIHGPGAWDASPWVAVIGFRVVRANIDTLAPDAPANAGGRT